MCEPDFVAIAFQKQIQTDKTCSKSRYCDLPLKKASEQEILRSKKLDLTKYKKILNLETATANNRKCYDCGENENPVEFLTDLNNYKKDLK